MAVLCTNLGSDSGYSYDEVPRPMYDSLGASGLGRFQVRVAAAADGEAAERCARGQDQAQHLLLRSGTWRGAARRSYTRRLRTTASTGSTSTLQANGTGAVLWPRLPEDEQWLVGVHGTENTDEAVEEYKSRKAELKPEVPTYTTSRIKPNTYFKAPNSPLVLPKTLNAYEYNGVRYKGYQDYVQVKNGHGTHGYSAVFKLKIQRIQDEGWTEIVDATDSPSSRGGGDGHERERPYPITSDSPVYRSTYAAPWPSVVDAVFAAAHAEARRRRRARRRVNVAFERFSIKKSLPPTDSNPWPAP